MSTGLLNQLETYFSGVDADQGPVTPEQVAELLDPVRELPSAAVAVRQRPRVWVAAVAAAVVLLLVGGVAWLMRGSSPEDVVDEPTPTTAVPETTAASLSTPLLWTAIDSGAPIFGTGEEAADSGLLNLQAPVYAIQSDNSGNLTITGQTADSTYLLGSADAAEWQEAVALPEDFGHFELFRSMDGKQITIAQYTGRDAFAVVVSGDGQTWDRYPIANRRSTSARAFYIYNICGWEPAVLGETVIYVECNNSWDHLYDLGVLTGPKRQVCEIGLDGTVLTAWHCEGEDEPEFEVTVDLETLDLSTAETEAALRPVSMLTVGVASNGEIVVEPTEIPIRGALSGITVSGDRFVMTTDGSSADHLGLEPDEAALYVSTDGLEWSEIDLPAGSSSLQIDSDVIFAIAEGQTGSGTTLWSSPDGAVWTDLAEFDDHDVHYVDSGMSGYVVTTRPGDHTSGLPEPDLGWSTDGTSWTWQSLSEALGGEPGDWAWARATVGDGFLIVLAQRSIQSLGYDIIEGNETELAPLLVPQWFIADLD